MNSVLYLDVAAARIDTRDFFPEFLLAGVKGLIVTPGSTLGEPSDLRGESNFDWPFARHLGDSDCLSDKIFFRINDLGVEGESNKVNWRSLRPEIGLEGGELSESGWEPSRFWVSAGDGMRRRRRRRASFNGDGELTGELPVNAGKGKTHRSSPPDPDKPESML